MNQHTNTLRYDSVIVPVDPDGYAEHAFPAAAAVADAFDTALVAVGSPDAVERHRPQLEQHLGRAIDSRYLAEIDSPAEMIAELAAGSKNPLAVMATHARRRVGYALHAGSTTEEVLRARACPVLLIGPNHDPNWRPGTGPLGVCLDGSDLSEHALPFATAWARRFNSPVRLLHVYDPPSTATTGALLHPVDVVAYGPGGDLATVVTATAPAADTGDHHQTDGETYVCGQANLLTNRGFETSWMARPGRNPARVIIDYLDDNPMNVLVVTTHGRAGVGRVVIGSTTMAITHDAPCPVLAYAPADQGNS